MNSSIFAGTVATFALAAAASASPYLGMSIDAVDNGGVIAGDTYRIYVDLEDGARIDAVFGNAEHTLTIGVDGGVFVQSPYGGNTSQDINPAFFGVFASIEFESFVTIGALTNVDNALNNIGVDWSNFEAGGDLVTDNGSWFVTPDDAQGDEVGNRVLIGQFTVTYGASVIGQVSLQGKDADGVTFQAKGVSWVPAPGALALLGVAGLAGRRRRR
jgi:hypothetical protein